MSKLFPRAGLLRSGYSVKQVDEFFDRVRQVYEQPLVDPADLSPLTIRQATFDLRYRGYRTDAVDTALDRLEDAFATRLRDQFVQAHGQAAWQQDLAARAQALYDNLRREPGTRFSRPGGMGKGYDAKQVDLLLDRLTSFFDTGAPIVPDEIRTAAFARRMKRRAYDEDEVDAYLAQAVDILQGVS
jgi:DivIVA domain-containing protein